MFTKLVSLCVAFTAAAAEFNVDYHSYKVPAMSFKDLNSKVGFSEAHFDSLTKAGIIAINEIPGFEAAKKAALTSAPHCGKDISKVSEFSDGTNRRTLATTVESGGIHSELEVSPECQEVFNNFRNLVSKTVDAFSRKLDQEFHRENGFLRALAASYESFEEVISNGQHLEHFHEYYRTTPKQEDEATIDWHLDQGLFIAFTTPLMKGGSEDIGEFYTRNIDGLYLKPDLNEQHDSIYIMFGDGVNQYINPMLSRDRQLYATPHVFTMPESADSRLWYGRMVLPPADGISKHGVTYGDIRLGLIDDPGSKDYMSMGCSEDFEARELSGAVCAEDAIFCWNRCMNFTAIGIYYNGVPLSDEFCKEEGYLGLACVDPALDTLYPSEECNDGSFANTPECPNRHGSFLPACTNSTTQDPPRALLPALECDEEEFKLFVESQAGEYPINLGYTSTFVVQAAVKEEEICFRVTSLGPMSWLSVGFWNPEGKQSGFETGTGVPTSRANVMMDTDVVMGIYTDPLAPGLGKVEEYRVHPSDTQFIPSPENSGVDAHLQPSKAKRGWGVPLAQKRITKESLLGDINSCLKEMKFCADGIGSTDFDLREGAVTDFMWAYQDRRIAMSKHTGPTRGIEQHDFGALAAQVPGASSTIKASSFVIASIFATIIMAFN